MTKVLLKSFKISKIPSKPKERPNMLKKHDLKLPKYPQNLKNDRNNPKT